MIPRTLSASSLQVAQLCMTRWNAEYMHRGSGFSNNAADVGTSFHGGAEMFVKAVYIDKTHTGLTRPEQKELLRTFYTMSYVQTFNSADTDTPEFEDGLRLTFRWFERTNLEEKQMLHVESAEQKETIKVPYNLPDGTQGEIDFNYIMDRVDQITETTWEVVDYKTIRVPLQPQDLENKIQARAYSLAIQIKHPEATKVKVTFDQIRHDPISWTFNRDDNIAFWRFLCGEVQRIVNTEEKDIRPTLNLECGYCVLKATCNKLKSNITSGGVHSLSIDELAQRFSDIRAQSKANKILEEEIGELLQIHAAQTDELSWETESGLEVEITAGRGRKFDASQAAAIMGPELFAQLGNITLGNLDNIIKDASLDSEMRSKLQSLVHWETGNLRTNVKPKKRIV